MKGPGLLSPQKTRGIWLLPPAGGAEEMELGSSQSCRGHTLQRGRCQLSTGSEMSRGERAARGHMALGRCRVSILVDTKNLSVGGPLQLALSLKVPLRGAGPDPSLFFCVSRLLHVV